MEAAANGELRVAIVGNARDPQPVFERVQQDGWELWGLNAIYPWGANLPWARSFNLHMFEHLKRDWAGRPQEVEMMKRAEGPALRARPWLRADGSKMLPNEQIFPGEEMMAKQPGGRYRAGSWDWLVAYAVYLGAVEITLHGVYLSLDSWRDEPVSARACLEYWIGYAEGQGIKVGLFDCDLMYQYHLVRSRTVYGYDDVAVVEERGIPTFDPRPIGWGKP
jgi:hypothetical protein